MANPTTLGELRSAGHEPSTVRAELRRNLKAALAEGRSIVPSIIGYDDIELAAYTVPPLTTIRQPAAEIGRRAAREDQ